MNNALMLRPFIGVALGAAFDAVVGAARPKAVALGVALPVAAQEGGSSVVYLVRHAEKADDDPCDPTLSEIGLERVDDLVRLLADVPFTNVFSTPYHRTLQTAAPIAESYQAAAGDGRQETRR